MQEIWVLSVKTSLPNTCENSTDWQTTCQAYDTFEKGRNALRETVKQFAFAKNSMFDGKGNILYFRDYVNQGYDPEEDGCEASPDFLDKKKLMMIADALQNAFAGKEVDFELPCEHADDDMLWVEQVGGALSIFGYGDGPYNGYTPDIRTNIFSMQEEKHYFLYINDIFGQDDASSELYIDLQKAELN